MNRMNPVTLHRLVYAVQIVAVVAVSVVAVYSEWWARRNEMNTAGRRRWIRRTPIVLGIVAALVASFLIGGNLVVARASRQADETARLIALLDSLPEPAGWPDYRVLPGPGDWPSHYVVDPYIQAAAELQARPAKEAVALLLGAASRHQDRFTNGDLDERTTILCRMLFSAKPENKPHYPGSFLCLYLGGTSGTDWPLAPIELVDGVPMVIAQPTPFINGRLPEEAQSYVRYCVANCDWNPLRYTPKTAAEKSAALAKLLASPKWRRPLDAGEQEFLSAQIRPLSR
jgi:hypothetical protein